MLYKYIMVKHTKRDDGSFEGLQLASEPPHYNSNAKNYQQEKEVATKARIAEQNGNIMDRVFRGMNALEPRHIRRSRLDAESEEFLKKRRESRGESRRGGRKSNRRKKTMHKKRKPAKNRNTKRMKSV